MRFYTIASLVFAIAHGIIPFIFRWSYGIALVGT